MTENILTIVFGCLATVLAIAGIVLACLQLRAHIRRSATDTSPSAMENAHSPVQTTSDLRPLPPRRSSGPNMLPIMISNDSFIALVSHCVQRSTYCASLTERA